MNTTHVFHMPNGNHVIKDTDSLALNFIREQVRLGCTISNAFYRNGEFVYELRSKR